jgi:glycosyltransferase involved in cell wall biosynthesis
VAGDAAVLLDPDDVEGFAAHIVRVLTDPALAREMAGKGLQRAKAFTWERTARETLDAYRRVAGL